MRHIFRDRIDMKAAMLMWLYYVAVTILNSGARILLSIEDNDYDMPVRVILSLTSVFKSCSSTSYCYAPIF